MEIFLKHVRVVKHFPWVGEKNIRVKRKNKNYLTALHACWSQKGVGKFFRSRASEQGPCLTAIILRLNNIEACWTSAKNSKMNGISGMHAFVFFMIHRMRWGRWLIGYFRFWERDCTTRIIESLLFSWVHQALEKIVSSRGGKRKTLRDTGLKYDNDNMKILRHCVSV